MNKIEVFKKVSMIIKDEVLNDEDIILDIETKIQNDLNLSSLDFVILLISLEKEFDIIIEDGVTINSFYTIGNIVDYICKNSIKCEL